MIDKLISLFIKFYAIHWSSIASRSDSLVGLLRYPFIPEAMHFSLVEGTALAVRAIIGILAANSEDNPSARISLDASNPLLTGMAQSMRIRSILVFLFGDVGADVVVLFNELSTGAEPGRATVGLIVTTPGALIVVAVSSDVNGEIGGGDDANSNGDVNVAHDKDPSIVC